MKNIIRLLVALVLIGAVAWAGYFFFENSSRDRTLYTFVPEDFVYLVESDKPVADWNRVSQSPVWRFLKGNEFFKDITESADYLDSLLATNQTLVNMVSLGDLLISAHMTSAQAYDFVVLLDLKGKGKKLPKLKPVLTSLFELFSYRVTTSQYFNFDIYTLYDPVARETMYLSTVDNVLIFSYTESLVKKAIAQSENPSVLDIPAFQEVRAKSDPGQPYTLYLNYPNLDRLIRSVMTDTPDMLEGLGEAARYSVMNLDLQPDGVVLDGYLRQQDSSASYLSLFSRSGDGDIRAGDVLPQRTALFTSVGFEDFERLYTLLEETYARQDPEGYKTRVREKEKIEKLLKIDFKRDFFSWMTEEVVTAVIPVDSAGTEMAYVAMLHFDDYETARERIEYVSKRVGKSPVKFEEKDYRGYTIKYLTLRGFFSIFFKKLFNKIEKPHYTFIDDYLVFSNDTTSLQVMIDSYLAEQTLSRDNAYQTFMRRFSRSSNVYTYLRTAHAIPYLMTSLDPAARADMQRNEAYFLRFPQIGFQLAPAGGMYRTQVYGAFEANTVR
ncbi:MAG: DUF3352 domain-containing protein [Bacteroidia bacterium]|nr:DUF3352 domain-containing protein [Bacteroidia bacterium]